MARGGEGGGQREGNALKTAVVVTGGLVLAWLTMESAFKPFLDRLRGALGRSTDPAGDPDAEEAAAAEPSAPPAPVEGVEEGEKKVEDKEVELEEKGDGGAAAKAE